MKDNAALQELDMMLVYNEHDIYVLDCLAEKLFGIKNFSKNAFKIKEMLDNGIIGTKVSGD